MEHKELNKICTILNGYSFKSEKYSDEGYRVIRITNVQKGLIVDDDPKFYSFEDMKDLKRYELFENDLLMSLTGNVGRVGIIDQNMLPAALNQRVACLRLKDKSVNLKYLFYWLNSDKFEKTCISNSNGIAQKNLSTEFLKSVPIPIPPLETQKKIVEALDKAQDLIDARKEQIRLMDELVKSRFVEMFGDPIHPIDYIKMDEVAILERGRFSPRPRNDPKYYNGLYPFIQTGDIANCNHRLSEYKQTLNEQGIRVSKLFKKGTIVMAIVGATIGATAILQIQVYAPDSVIGITVKTEKCEPVFLETLLQFWKPELQRRAPESARANINLSILNEIPIIRADINEQIVFSKFVKQIDKSKSEMKKRLDEFITTQQALMQQYFG